MLREIAAREISWQLTRSVHSWRVCAEVNTATSLTFQVQFQRLP